MRIISSIKKPKQTGSSDKITCLCNSSTTARLSTLTSIRTKRLRQPLYVLFITKDDKFDILTFVNCFHSKYRTIFDTCQLMTRRLENGPRSCRSDWQLDAFGLRPIASVQSGHRNYWRIIFPNSGGDTERIELDPEQTSIFGN